MELRRAADALLRSQVSPLAAFLTPSTASRWQAGRQLSYRQPSHRSAHRSFGTTTQRYALKPQATTSAAPSAPSEPKSGSTTNTSTTPPKSNSEFSSEESLDDLTASLNWAARPTRTSRFSSSPADGKLEREKLMNGGTSASDLLKALNERKPPSSGIDVSRMLNPLGGPGLSNKDIMGSISDSLTMPKVERIPMKLNPSTGRSVTIGAGIDVGRGFRLMEQSCARNKVRSDATKQRFHERGGLKRKRLRRERWRRKFLEGFKATVGRVKQLKNQGW